MNNADCAGAQKTILNTFAQVVLLLANLSDIIR